MSIASTTIGLCYLAGVSKIWVVDDEGVIKQNVIKKNSKYIHQNKI